MMNKYCRANLTKLGKHFKCGITMNAAFWQKHCASVVYWLLAWNIQTCMASNTGGVMVKTCAPNLKLQGSGPTSVRAFFSFPLFNLSVLELTQLYPIE